MLGTHTINQSICTRYSKLIARVLASTCIPQKDEADVDKLNMLPVILFQPFGTTLVPMYHEIEDVFRPK